MGLLRRITTIGALVLLLTWLLHPAANRVPGHRPASAMLATAMRVPAPRRRIVPLGFIGDSITQGLFTATPAPALTCADLSGPSLTVVAINEGHGGTRAGDWLPGAPTGYLAAAYAAFHAAGVHLVQVMIGTNDAAQSVPTANYAANLAALVADLTAHGYTVVLADPPASAGLLTNIRLAEQEPARAALVNGTTVLRGDTAAYGYFLAHPDELTGRGLHPDDAGTAVLARDWAAALWQPLRDLQRP